MSTSNSTHNNLLQKLKADYPNFNFKESKQENWSPKTNTISYNPNNPCYGVLHELAHAILGHSNYNSDFELLKLESDAWELATKIAKKYGAQIDDDHIQDCLDTYREWLHRRSACPSCGTHVLQNNSNKYHCFNCQTKWNVSSGKFVRPYRLKEKTAYA